MTRRTKTAPMPPTLPMPVAGSGPFSRSEREALETIAGLLAEANDVYERAFFGERHKTLQHDGDMLFQNLRSGRQQTARLRGQYAPRLPLLLADTKRASDLPIPLAVGTRVLVEHDRIRAESRGDVLAVSGGIGATGWRIKHDFRPMGVLMIEGTTPLGEKLEMPVSPDTILADIRGEPHAV